MKKEKLFTLSNILASLCLMLFFISFAVTVSLNFRPLYYNDIKALNIPENTGMTAEEIKENYDALIDYNSVFYTGELEFPSLNMSETGKIHFEEVKDVFVFFQILCAVTFILSAIFIFIKLKKEEYKFLKLSAIFSVAIPLLVGVFVAVAWEWFFVLFHKMVFRNDYWVFDPVLDPVITILPNEYFMHAAVLIIASVIIFAAVTFIAYRLFMRKKG